MHFASELITPRVNLHMLLVLSKCYFFEWLKLLTGYCPSDRIKLTALSTSRQGPAVLGHVVAESTFILTNRARYLLRTCTMDLALLGSRTRGLRSVRYCFHVADAVS